jgi:hypothetical protein
MFFLYFTLCLNGLMVFNVNIKHYSNINVKIDILPKTDTLRIIHKLPAELLHWKGIDTIGIGLE